MVKKRAFANELFEDETWLAEAESDDDVRSIDGDEGVGDDVLATRKTARQRLEEYFELKRLRQLLDEELTGDFFSR